MGAPDAPVAPDAPDAPVTAEAPDGATVVPAALVVTAVPFVTAGLAGVKTGAVPFIGVIAAVPFSEKTWLNICRYSKVAFLFSTKVLCD